MAGDLLWDSVVLALHMDDVGLTDVKGHAMTLNGGVTRSATESVFGGYAAYFDGTDDELYNTDPITEIGSGNFSAQLWCRPDAQAQANPVVLAVQDILIEYKPTGYTNGFVINSAGVRTACGEFAEGEWHYIDIEKTSEARTIFINGIFIASIAGGDDGYAQSIIVGSNTIGANPDSAFTGYIDDLRVACNVIRDDPSIPIAAFPDSLPDPEGGVVGGFGFAGLADGIVVPFGAVASGLGFTGVSVGIVAPIGVVTGGLQFIGTAVGDAPANGGVVGGLRFSGASSGIVGRAGSVVGSLRFSGSAVGSVAKFGAVTGALRFLGSAAGGHGVSGQVSGALQFSGAVVGTTPIVPAGPVVGALRFSGRAVGLGAQVEEDACA